MKSPPDFKVGKRSRRAVFDLRDMLIAVEDAEDEALHTEKSKKSYLLNQRYFKGGTPEHYMYFFEYQV